MSVWWQRLAAGVRAVLGSVTYRAPPWLQALGAVVARGGRWVRAHRAVLWVPLALAAGVVGWQVVESRRPPPPPVLELSASLTPPQAPRPRRKADEAPPPDPLIVQFNGSAAPLEAIHKAVSEGVRLEPSLPGTWTWDSEQALVFRPTEPWPIGTAYRVTVEKRLVERPGVKLVGGALRFSTDPFKAVLAEFSFDQDPVDPLLKRVVGTVRFNYPVDPKSFEPRLGLTTYPASNDTQRSSTRFTVAYDALKFEAYVTSENLPLPQEQHWAELTLKAGARAQAPGAPAEGDDRRRAEIPGKGDRFRVNEAKVSIASGADGAPEQVLSFACTSSVSQARLGKAMKVWQLPKGRPASKAAPADPNHRWSAAEVGKEVLAKSTALPSRAIAGEQEVAEVQSFGLEVAPFTQLFVRVESGLEGFGGYTLLKPFEAVLEVPAFPRELRLAHEGAVLSATGDKKLTVMARGLPGFKVTLGRVLPGNLNHLITQSSGDLAQLELLGRFGEGNLTEVFSEERALDGRDPKAAQYASIDFAQYLKVGSEQRGLFFVRVEAWDPVTHRPPDAPAPPAPIQAAEVVDGDGAQPDEGEEGRDEGEGAPPEAAELSDRRFVLLTDLGLVDKVDAKGSHFVYVHSFRGGAPVSGATVEVLARNGTVLVAQPTDGTGVARLPALSDFRAEKQPVALVARSGADLSFLPLGRSERTLELSRFDVGGVRTRGSPGALSAYAFSDRGLYRPGETVHLAAIVRAVDWSKKLEGLPLQLSVVDPRGTEVRRSRVNLEASGFLEYAFTPGPSAPTGSWSFELKVAQDAQAPVRLGSTSFRVEEFLPDRLRIAAQLEGEGAGWRIGTELSAKVALKNLFGTPAAEHRVTGSLVLEPYEPSFAAFPGFTFGDPSRAKRSESQELEETSTDAQGEARYALSLKAFAPSTWLVRFYAQGFELGGGRSVSAAASAVISPRAYLVGFKPDGELGFLKRGAPRKIEVVAVGNTLERVAASGLELVLLQQRDVSVLARDAAGRYRYVSVRKELTLKREPLALPANGTTLSLPTEAAGTFFLSLREPGDVEVARIPFTVTGEANLARELEKNAELKVTLDRPDYAPGDTISLQVVAPYAGSGLITIERDRVYAHKSFKTTTNSAVLSIEVPAGLEVNGYVHVAFVRALDAPELYVSPLSSGVVPFSLSRAKQTLEVTLESEPVVKPGRELRIGYRTARPSKIAVYAVDEGILRVAHHPLPDPLGFFLSRRALEVSTHQLLDLLLPEFHLVEQRGKQGGDSEGGEAGNLNPFRRTADAPAVYWSGLLDAGPQLRSVGFTVPESFAGALKLMAVAVAPDAMGTAERQTLVRGPFVLLPTVPTFVSPGDVLEVSTSVANLVKGSGPAASVTVALKAGEGLQVQGAPRQTLTIPEGKEALVRFEVKASQALGDVPLTFLASGGQEELSRTVHLSLRPPNPFTVEAVGGALRDGKAELELDRTLYDALARRQLQLSVLPLGLSAAPVEYLEAYPHLCTEQLSSRAVPALVFSRRAEWGSPSARAAQAQALERAFEVLTERQNAQGGFGYWASNGMTVEALHPYLTLLLTEAKERGLPRPEAVHAQALEALRAQAQHTPTTLAEAREAAQQLYVLARNAQQLPAQTAAVADFLVRQGARAKGDLAFAWLASTYQLTNTPKRAEAMLELGPSGALEEAAGDRTAGAQLLYLVARHFPARLEALGPGLLQALAASFKAGQHSLQAGWALYALDAYAAALEQRGAGAALTGVTLEQADAAGAWSPLPFTGKLSASIALPSTVKAVRVKAAGPMVFYGLTQAGFDREPPTVARRSGLELIHSYEDGAGREVTRVKLGDEVTVKLKLRSLAPGLSVEQVAVVELLPSGFELVLNEGPGLQGLARLVGSEATWAPQHVDAREDRLIFYGTAGPSVEELSFRLRAVARGRFTTPPASAEAMYAPQMKARSVAGTLQVE